MHHNEKSPFFYFLATALLWLWLEPLQILLVLAHLINVSLVLALPRQVEIVKATLVERDEQVDAVVAKVNGHAGIHDLLRRASVSIERRYGNFLLSFLY